ncbi:MAG TPA: hypothetical protein PLQ76_02885 [bacterium]|nr:hypothetical protein [bacterium]
MVLNPRTIEEKDSLSVLIVSGVVKSISDPRSESRDVRRTARATFRISEVFKGAVASDTIYVDFLISRNPARPPLVDFRSGEKCILFLKNTASPDGFEPITPTAGKESLSNDVLDVLRKKNASANKAARGLKLELSLSKGAGPGDIVIEVKLNNKTAGDVPAYSDLGKAVEIYVKNENGTNLPSDLEARGGGEVIMLKPGGFIGFELNIPEHFRLDQPGRYTVGARIALPGQSSGAARTPVLTSNEISFTVSAAPAKK